MCTAFKVIKLSVCAQVTFSQERVGKTKGNLGATTEVVWKWKIKTSPKNVWFCSL